MFKKNILSEFVAVEVWSYVEGEVDGRDDAQRCSDEVGVGEGCVLRNDATKDESDTDADIPRGEVGGGGSATLIVLGEVDKQSVVGREYDAKTNTDEQSYCAEYQVESVRKVLADRQASS